MLQWIGKNVNFDYIKKYGTSAVCFFAIEPITVCYFFSIFYHMVLHVCVQVVSIIKKVNLGKCLKYKLLPGTS